MPDVRTIGVDARHLLSSTPSGVGLSTRALLREMIVRADPARVRFVLFANAARESVDVLDDLASYEHVEVINPGIPNRLLNLCVLLFGRPVIERFIGSVDVLWSPNVLFLGVRSTTPLVLTVHDLSFLVYPETFSLWRRLWHKAVRAVALMKRADILVAVSHSTKQDVVGMLGIDASRVKVIHHASMPVVHADRCSRPAAFSVPEDTPFVLFVSTLEPRKNLLALLQAYEDTVATAGVPHHLVLAGAWGWSSHALKRAIDRSSVRERIHVLGYVSEEEKWWLFGKATCLAFPSLYEGFGVPILEAFVSRVPVLASSTAAVAETAGDAAVLVNPLDIGEIQFGLEQLLTDASLRSLCIERGERRVAEFSWEVSADAMLDVLMRAQKGAV